MTVFSFASAAPSLPRAVLEAFRKDAAGWRGGGQSVLALPFTGREFGALLDAVEGSLRTLLGIPSHYHVLFLQGGASAHFALLAMNLAGNGRAAYVETGHWSRRAIAEASPWCRVEIAARGDGVSLPPWDSWRIPEGSAYCHYTSNETADGLQLRTEPDVAGTPLVADMSADLLSAPISVERFGMIYASGQKNLGAAGLTVVIVRSDLPGKAMRGTPAPFDYTRQAAQKSKVNTPPSAALAIACCMLDWIAEKGGLGVMAGRNRRKAAMLYALIGSGGFYGSPVAEPARSRVSVRFHLPTPELELQFLQEAEESGFLHLKGHPAIGGLRASLYNPVTEEAVAALVEFMADFRRRRG